MQRFFVIWLGQLLSIVGSGLSGFALGVWVYQREGSVSRFALVMLCVTVPGIVAAPFAGSLVDRWRRRQAMVLADAAAGLSTAVLLGAYLHGSLGYGLILAASTVTSIAAAFQQPAWLAAVALLVPRGQLGRANGMSSLSTAVSGIVGPLAGGALLVASNLGVVLAIDLVTFGFALVTLLVVRFREPVPEAKPPARVGTLLAESLAGWRWVQARPGLFGLLLFSMPNSLRLGFIHVLTTPLVLSMTDAATLGAVLSVGGLGMVAGSVLMIAWGGPTRRVYGVLGSELAIALALVMAAWRPSVHLFGAACFVFFFTLPIANSCVNTLWQVKVPAALHGRIFGINRLTAWVALPVGQLLAGPLAERVFEPAMMPGGWLAPTVGSWIGVGPGRGMAAILALLGVLSLGLAVFGLVLRTLRRVDLDVSDAPSVSPEAELAQAPATL